MADVYRIGVAIAMQNGVSSVLHIIQRDLLGLQKSIDMTTGKFGRMHLAVYGLGAALVGGGILAGMAALGRHGEAYIHQLEQMRAMGFSVAEQQRAIAAANRVAGQIQTTTPTENLQAIRELRMALNSAGASPAAATDEAIKYLGVVQKAQAVMSSALGKEHGSDVYDMVKALEEIGATSNPERFAKLIDGMTRASTASGGRLTSRDWFQTLKYSRGAGLGYSDEFLIEYLPTLMQEMKTGKGSGAGGGAGNPLASLYQAMVAGRIGGSIGEWLKIGLLDPKKVHYTKGGKPLYVDPGGVNGSLEGVSNPFFWVRDFLEPALKRAGITDPARIRQEIAVLFGNRVAQQMVGLLQQTRKMEGGRNLVNGAEGIDPAYEHLRKYDPVIVHAELAAQWERLLADLGKAMPTTAMLRMFAGLANSLSYLSGVIEAHPTATKWILAVVGALGALLTVVGGIAIAAAGFAALGTVGLSAAAIAAGTAAIVGLFGAIAVAFSLVNWRDMMAAAKAMIAGIAGWGQRVLAATQLWVREASDYIASALVNVKGFLANLWQGITGAVNDAAAKIADTIKGLIQKIVDAVTGFLPKAGPAPTTPNEHQSGQPMIIPQAFRAPAHDGHETVVHNIVYLDGQQVARSVSRRQAAHASLPGASGPNWFDLSTMPITPGQLVHA